tara:strand:- start:732 stop:1124 length:393 start_codon:yes stop_codon:yes gene_type:complete
MTSPGRPKIEITPEVCQKAESLAAQGLTMDQIASVLGMGERTIYEKQAEYPHLAQSIKDGRSKGIATVSNALFTKAKAGDNTAMIFYLKNRDPDNWEEVQKRQHSGPEGGPIEIDTHWTVEVVEPKDNEE